MARARRKKAAAPSPMDNPAVASQVKQVLSKLGSEDSIVEPGGITRAMVRMNPHLFPHIKL